MRTRLLTKEPVRHKASTDPDGRRPKTAKNRRTNLKHLGTAAPLLPAPAVLAGPLPYPSKRPPLLCRAFHAADAPPVDAAILTAADPEAVRLILHPSVILLRLSHPAVSIWARNQSAAEALPVGTGPETALMLRDAAFAVPVRALGVGDAAFVEATLCGEALAEADRRAQRHEPGHDPHPILVTLMRAGAIIDAKV